MNRSTLVTELAARTRLTAAETGAVLDALTGVLAETLARGEEVRIPGLLTAERVHRAARAGRNPRTGEELQIAARHAVRLTPGSTLKNAV